MAVRLVGKAQGRGVKEVVQLVRDVRESVSLSGRVFVFGLN